jgi:antitoxin component YwqK of YwqJK toxin-antitoxin module
MKIIYTLLTFSCLLFACQSNKKNPADTSIKKENLVEFKNGIYTEWYPGKKNKKFEGPKDENYQRNGKWIFYSEKGDEQSITYYTNGLKDGFTMVKYPSGRMHYRGEYKNDKIVGLWSTYDESGKITNEKDYGYKGK